MHVWLCNNCTAPGGRPFPSPKVCFVGRQKEKIIYLFVTSEALESVRFGRLGAIELKAGRCDGAIMQSMWVCQSVSNRSNYFNACVWRTARGEFSPKAWAAPSCSSAPTCVCKCRWASLIWAIPDRQARLKRGSARMCVHTRTHMHTYIEWEPGQCII